MPKKLEYLKKLRTLHKEKTGHDLTEEKAEEYFELLIGLVQASYQPIILRHGTASA